MQEMLTKASSSADTLRARAIHRNLLIPIAINLLRLV
jgi:hypothetical protein